MAKKQVSLIDQISSMENLILAWRRVEHSFHHGDVWYDELELAEYKFRLLDNLDELSIQIKNGSFSMAPIKPAPYPKATKVKEADASNGENVDKELCVRQSFYIPIIDQIVWMAVYNVIGYIFERQMPAWSFGNRLFLNTWKDENGYWQNGIYRATSINFYRPWKQSWPLYRRKLAVCIKRMAFPEDKQEQNLTPEEEHELKEDQCQVNEVFKVPYMQDGYFSGNNHQELYYRTLDLKKFYPHVKMKAIRDKIHKECCNHCTESYGIDFEKLITIICDFPLDRSDFSNNDLDKMEITRNDKFDSLPTGLIVAGAIANLYLLDVDKKAVDELEKDKQHKIMHFRYVDDHLFISPDKKALDEWYSQYASLLKASGLEVNEDKSEQGPLNTHYPTPLITQTLQKVSELSKMSLDLLSSSEFEMVYRDLQMLLVSDFSDEEIKKGTRVSFACTMLTRLVADVDVDYGEIHRLKIRWLKDLEVLKHTIDPKKRNRIETFQSFIFANHPNFIKNLTKEESDLLGKVFTEDYKDFCSLISKSREKIVNTEKKVYNLLVYALKETPDKPKMWLRVLDFCIFDLPSKLDNLFILLRTLKKDNEIHPLGYEYILSAMNLHLADRILLVIYRLNKDDYDTPLQRDIDIQFLKTVKRLKSNHKVRNSKSHYLYKDSLFILNKSLSLLRSIYSKSKDCNNKEKYNNDFFVEIAYHEKTLDSTFWVAWLINSFRIDTYNHDDTITEFLHSYLKKVSNKSPYFEYIFLSLLNRLPELSLDDIGVEPGMKWIEKAAPIIAQSILECESSDKIAEKFGLKTYYDKLIADEEKQISVLNWIRKTNQIAKKTDNYLEKGIVSEYAATLLMKQITKKCIKMMQQFKDLALHPTAIKLPKEKVIIENWDEWLSVDDFSDEIVILKKDESPNCALYLYPNKINDTEDPLLGYIYGLGLIFLQLLTRRVSLPWVFSSPEYGFEWESVLFHLLENGTVSSTNYKIVRSCLSITNRETLRLRRTLGSNYPVIVNDPLETDVIQSLEELETQLDKSLKELKANQISVANRETRQLVVIKVGK